MEIHIFTNITEKMKPGQEILFLAKYLQRLLYSGYLTPFCKLFVFCAFFHYQISHDNVRSIRNRTSINLSTDIHYDVFFYPEQRSTFQVKNSFPIVLCIIRLNRNVNQRAINVVDSRNRASNQVSIVVVFDRRTLFKPLRAFKYRSISLGSRHLSISA